jgi:hypothetical protein
MTCELLLRPSSPQERVAAVETALREHSEVKEADLRNLVSMVGERVSGLADRLGSTHAEGVEHLQKHDEALQLLERRHVRFNPERRYSLASRVHARSRHPWSGVGPPLTTRTHWRGLGRTRRRRPRRR